MGIPAEYLLLDTDYVGLHSWFDKPVLQWGFSAWRTEYVVDYFWKEESPRTADLVLFPFIEA